MCRTRDIRLKIHYQHIAKSPHHQWRVEESSLRDETKLKIKSLITKINYLTCMYLWGLALTVHRMN